MLLFLVLLSSIKLCFGYTAQYSCQITNVTYNINYTQILFSFPVKATNSFYFYDSAYSFEMTAEYNISIPEMDCSVSNSTTYKNVYNVNQTLIGGTTCFFKTPLLFSLNLTVSGRTSLQTNRSSSFYGGCVGWIYLNVSKPSPTPDPDPKPTPTPTPNPATQSQINQLTKTLTIMGIVMIVLMSLGLIVLVVIVFKKNKPSSNFEPVPASNGYIRQN